MANPKHCRLWLPKLLCVRPEASLAMVGWVNVGLHAIDVVVVAACSVSQFSNVIMGLQEILDATEKKLPDTLRTQRKLCIVGEILAAIVFRGRDQDDEGGIVSEAVATEECMMKFAETDWLRSFQREVNSSTDVSAGVCSNFSSPDVASNTKVWAMVSSRRSRGKSNELEWTPFLLRSLSLGGSTTIVRDHIIIYQQAVFGSHHYSSLSWTWCQGNSQDPSCQSRKTPVKQPQWLITLEQQQEVSDLETVMLELNCGMYIVGTVNGVQPPCGTSYNQSRAYSICCSYIWYAIAAALSIFATMFYALAVVLTVWLPRVPYLRSLLQRSMTWQTMHIRCEQLMAWPFILLWGGLGPEQPDVAVSHKLVIRRHTTWSVLLIDKTVGAIVGLLLLQHRGAIAEKVVQTGKSLTTDVLRTGCVWLMGVPAGFKLNNELAAAFGTLSLHLIQSWSTLFETLIPGIGVILDVLGISGFLLGFTVSAAMVSDMIFLSTVHISCLHHTIAFLHTTQLRALAALWRLFRGRKRNPLRGRLDTFDCSVEQLVVGSLMFTPLLLLLPTTSVFYTFFSIIFLTLSSLQLVLHYLIAIFHCFPFALVVRWILRPEQFPSGIWFHLPQTTIIGTKQEAALLSTLGIQPASFGELLKPFLRSLLATLEWSSAASFVYKVVSGERYNLSLQLRSFGSLPHTRVSLSGFARLCFMAGANLEWKYSGGFKLFQQLTKISSQVPSKGVEKKTGSVETEAWAERTACTSTSP